MKIDVILDGNDDNQFIIDNIDRIGLIRDLKYLTLDVEFVKQYVDKFKVSRVDMTAAFSSEGCELYIPEQYHVAFAKQIIKMCGKYEITNPSQELIDYMKVVTL